MRNLFSVSNGCHGYNLQRPISEDLWPVFPMGMSDLLPCNVINALSCLVGMKMLKMASLALYWHTLAYPNIGINESKCLTYSYI